MREESLQFLKALVEAGGPSGYEGPIQALFRRQVEPLAECVTTDVMGNTTAVLCVNESSPVLMSVSLAAGLLAVRATAAALSVVAPTV